MSGNLFFELEDKNWKSFLATNEEIIVSSKGHSNEEAILAAKNDKGILESIKVIPINNIQKIKFKEGAKEADFSYYSSKENSITLTFSNPSALQQVVEFLSPKVGLKHTISSEGKIKPLLLNLLLVVLGLATTFYFRGIAVNAALGGHEVATGRKRGIAQMMYNAVEWLGPLWTTLIGLGISGYLAYNAYQRFQTPLNDIEYTR
jgi:hypothetical protein